MKNTLATLALFLAPFFVGSLQAQSSQSFAKAIIGTWNGSGTLFKQKATFHMKWENELNDKFIKLTFKNGFENQTGVERVMKANAYYHLEQNKGYWFDSRGMMLPLTLEKGENSMTVLWGNELSERGKTIYSIIDEEHVNVQDYVLMDDTYSLFGEATYEKIKE